MAKQKKRKKILIADDEPDIRSSFRAFLENYSDTLEVADAKNAGEVMEQFDPLDPNKIPEAIILDVMMPYGTAKDLPGQEKDKKQLNTGLNILRYIRNLEAKNDSSKPLIWVAVVTARSNPQVLKDLKDLLKNRGKLYLKPVNDLVLEHDLVQAIGIESKVDPIFLSMVSDRKKQGEGQ